MEKLPSIDTLCVPNDPFASSRHVARDLSVDFFDEKDRDVAIRYEYYMRCIKNRPRSHLKRWVRAGYSLIDLIFSDKFDDHGCLTKQGMHQLRYESMLGMHIL